jgi:hypothetical protein
VLRVRAPGFKFTSKLSTAEFCHRLPRLAGSAQDSMECQCAAAAPGPTRRLECRSAVNAAAGARTRRQATVISWPPAVGPGPGHCQLREVPGPGDPPGAGHH